MVYFYRWLGYGVRLPVGFNHARFIKFTYSRLLNYSSSLCDYGF